MNRLTADEFGPNPPLAGGLSGESQRMRRATLTRLRWLSVGGQTVTCVFVAWGLWYPYPVWAAFALIALSVALNLALTFRHGKSERLSTRFVTAVLTFDILQPAALLFLTGGIENPFAIFLLVPVLIAAATQPARSTLLLGTLAIMAATVLAFAAMPLPWPEDPPYKVPTPYLGGIWFAIVSTLVFATFYVYRVAAEARALSDALAATELVLQREQHLSALDGLAAAAAHELGTPLATIALVAKDMSRTTPAGHPMREDVDLLVTQTERCRDILRQLSSLSSSSEEHLSRLALTALVEEVVAPHRNFGVALRVAAGGRDGPEPVMRRNAGVAYGLGNIVENAVDFAASEVTITYGWGGEQVTLEIVDDGPGFPPEVLARIGDPYMAPSVSTPRPSGGGLGLGLFIAKTLLERSGARIVFANRAEADGAGARVRVSWPREAFPRPAAPAGEDEDVLPSLAVPLA